MKILDQAQRFLIESASIRGVIVQLNNSLQHCFTHHHYTPNERQLLSEALTSSVLLSATIKFSGHLSLQIQGNAAAPLSLLFAQCDNYFNIRGILRARQKIVSTDIRAIAPGGQMAITIQADQQTQPYQSLVGLEAPQLAQCLENYFSQSEQLPTRLYLFSEGEQAAGLLLQVVPEKDRTEDDWQRITLLADTLTAKEIVTLTPQTIVERLFHEETVRVFSPQRVRFRCSCSIEKMQDALRLLGSEEAHTILAEEGKVEVSCDFCQQHYAFNKIDVQRIFGENIHLLSQN